jgi:hypothetical protein
MARMLHRRRFARNPPTSAGVARHDGDLRRRKGAGAPPRGRLTEEGHDASTEAPRVAKSSLDNEGIGVNPDYCDVARQAVAVTLRHRCATVAARHE